MISRGKVIRTGAFFSIVNFLITAGIGVLLRYNTLFPIRDFPDRYWIHAHSHIGFLGWVFVALMILGFGILLPQGGRISKKMYRLLIYIEISVLGLLVTFPFEGYGVLSIFFLTLHMVLSLLFVILFYRQGRKNDLPTKFYKAGLVFMLISGIGPIALGPIVVFGLKDSPLYELSIYYYLHFQYNGWFTLAVFGLFFRLLMQSGISLPEKKVRQFYRLLVMAIILTMALSVPGIEDSWHMRLLGGVGAALQLWAGYLFLQIIFLHKGPEKLFIHPLIKWLFGIALFSWLIKLLLQFLSPFPVIMEFGYTSRDAIIAYLHLTYLGFTSAFIIAVFIIKNYISVIHRITKLAIALFMIVTVLMEITIGLRSLPRLIGLEFLRTIHYALLVETVILFIAVAILLFYGFLIPKRAVRHKAMH